MQSLHVFSIARPLNTWLPLEIKLNMACPAENCIVLKSHVPSTDGLQKLANYIRKAGSIKCEIKA